MPIYGYVCETCKKETEDLRSFKDADEPMKCPDCGAAAFRNPINAGTTFITKGGGCYREGQPKYPLKNKRRS